MTADPVVDVAPVIAPPGFFARLALAFQVLFNALLARKLLLPEATTTTTSKTVVEEKIVEKIVEKVVEKKAPPEEGALHLLAILQRDGRFVDFLREDISGFKDADVGAAARLVHQGCKKSLDAYFVLEPVRKEAEGAAVVVDKGFDAHALRLAGDVKGEPPWKGTLAHAGWRALEIKLPERPGFVDARIVAPAEIEVKA